MDIKEEEYVNVETVDNGGYPSGEVIVIHACGITEDSPPECQGCVKQTGHKKPFYQKGRW